MKDFIIFSTQTCTNCDVTHEWNEKDFVAAETPRDKLRVCLCGNCVAKFDSLGVELGVIYTLVEKAVKEGRVVLDRLKQKK